MGNGIAQVAAASGLEVVLSDIKQEFADKGRAAIARNLSRLVEKGKLTQQDVDDTLTKITATANLHDMANVDFIVEAAVEKEELKFMLFQDLDKICKSETILSSNTSSIPIGRIAAQTSRPDKVIGMHFMNPVPVMKLVEVIRGLATSEKTFQTTWNLCHKFKKTPAEAIDFP